MEVKPAEGKSFDTEFPVVIIGGGSFSLTAALTLKNSGTAAVVLEQGARGVDDMLELMAGDIQAKAKQLADPCPIFLLAAGRLVKF